MNKKVIYLCGPITGNNYSECTEWRDYAVQVLESKGFGVISPMRGKAYLAKEKNIKDAYEGTLHSGKHTIYKRDKFDVSRCDIILSNLSRASQVSIGSVAEIAWADVWNKYVIIVMEEGNIHNHAFIKEMAGIVLPDLDKALDYIIATFGD